MFKWFSRPKRKPRDTREMIRVLRAAAQFSDDLETKREYEGAADALDRVLTAAERHSDAPTRDAFAYALGRAELDLGDKLAELIETSKDTHLLVQDVHQAQVAQGAATEQLRAEFQQFGEDLSGRMNGLEQRMDASETDRRDIHQAINAMNDRHGGQISAIDQRLMEIERLLEIAGGHEAGG
jgi:hypothetical protein